MGSSSSSNNNNINNKEMKDEYGELTSEGETFVKHDFVLENGFVFPFVQLRYQTYGTLNDARDNVLVVCHALTGNASLHSWWGNLLGDHKAFDTSKYFIVCCNILGSCYGSTNPQSINPKTGIPYGKDFPNVSVRDTVRLQLLLLKEELQVRSIRSVIGGSFGGMQAMEFAVLEGSSCANNTLSEKHNNNNHNHNHNPATTTTTTTPTVADECYVRSVIPIACGAMHTAWQIAISEVQRQVIYADPLWNDDPFLATKGLDVARQMAMISYRTPQGYQTKFGRSIQETSYSYQKEKENEERSGGDPQQSQQQPNHHACYGKETFWQVKSYLENQGSKFVDRFDPITYVRLTEQMDSHDLARNRGVSSVSEVLRTIQIPMCVLGIDSDVLYPLSEQEEIATHVPNSELWVIHSEEGHDGFLLEQEQVARHIIDFLDRQQ